MEQFLIDEAIEIINGRMIQRGEARAFQGVSIDSRRIVPGISSSPSSAKIWMGMIISPGRRGGGCGRIDPEKRRGGT